MLNKHATYNSLIPVEVLFNPDFSSGRFNYIKKLDLKIASKEATTIKDGDNVTFDLETEVKEHPDFLYVKNFAIKANETNDNGDWFSTDELKKATPSFINCPVFTNHQNNDIEKAKGKIIHSWYDDEKDGIMTIARIDAVAYPHIARGVQTGVMLSSSMGCSVNVSICSICHNAATKPTDYCHCIKEQKRKVLSGTTQCKYHDHGTEEQCPLCESKKGENRIITYANQEVHEKNYGIRFIEDSLVVSPACHDCGITEVIDISKFLKKVAEINDILPGLLKSASSHPIACAESNCIYIVGEEEDKIIRGALEHVNSIAEKLKHFVLAEKIAETVKNMPKMHKMAGQKELDDLKTALELISNVSKKMIDQKAQIDLEFLEDLVKVMSGLQEVSDELAQMGYGRLSSPEETAGGIPTETTTTPALSPEGGQAGITPAIPPAGGSKIQSGSAGQVGTVTSPLAGSRKGVIKLGFGKVAKRKGITLSPKLTKTAKRINLWKDK